METDDIFSDQMQVRGPVFLKLFAAFAAAVISDTCDVIGQRVQPYINHMLLIKSNRNPPFKRSTRHAQILQARKQEIIHHLIFPGYGLNKLRMRIDMRNQTIRIFTHLKKVGFLFSRLHLATAVGTFSVHKLRLGKERFTGRAVHAFIMPFIDIPFVIHIFKDLLHLLFMLFIRRTDKLIVGSVHQIPDRADLPGHVIYKFFRRNPCFCRF